MFFIVGSPQECTKWRNVPSALDCKLLNPKPPNAHIPWKLTAVEGEVASGPQPSMTKACLLLAGFRGGLRGLGAF